MKQKYYLIAAALVSPILTVAQSIPNAADLNVDPVPSNACGDIVNANNGNETTPPYYWFLASDAIECLKSVAFNPAVATRFLEYYNQTLQFQSTLAYLRNPPSGYQQPAYDVLASVRSIRDKVDSGYYRNQLAFDADVQAILLHTHDSHVSLIAGILPRFTFGAPFLIASVSRDGKEAPQIYSWDDIESYTRNSSHQPIPIQSIDGVPIVQYLEQLAASQSFGMIEPHADWNSMMMSPAQAIVGAGNTFSGGLPFYPGDNMTVRTGENEQQIPWVALYNSPGFAGPLETGGDFYNFFVAGWEPASYNSTLKTYEAQMQAYQRAHPARVDPDYEPLKSWNSISAAYPNNPISYQKQLGVATSGFVTGYYIDDISTAVLSIPSFDDYDEGVADFSQAMIDFVGNATRPDRAAQKLIIDLQQNHGGDIGLVFDVIRALFPSVSPPSANSRMRSHPLADYLGSTMTGYFESLRTSNVNYDYLVNEEWVVTDRINAATKRNFSSWQEFYGPLDYNGDTFSLIEQYNLSSQTFTEDAFDLDYASCFYNGTGACGRKDPWQGNQVVLLTDGLCASSCSLFVELVTELVGAKTVVLGGNPKTGPMQISGTRGALMYSSDEIDNDFDYARLMPTAPPFRYNSDTGMFIDSMTINLRDQMRLDSQGVPNQFLYLPADCRLFYTLANVNNYTRLWHDVHDAIFTDSSLCVPGSTNVTAAPAKRRARQQKRHESTISDSILSIFPETDHAVSDYEDGLAPPPSGIVFCHGDFRQCGQGFAACLPLTIPCQNACRGRGCKPTISQPKEYVCVREQRQDYGCAGKFVPNANLNSRASADVVDGGRFTGFAAQLGYCYPPVTNTAGLYPNCRSLG